MFVSMALTIYHKLIGYENSYNLKLTLTIVFPLISHITRGLGCPVTRQQKRAHSPSSTVAGSGRLTNTGAQRAFVSSAGASGTLFVDMLYYGLKQNFYRCRLSIKSSKSISKYSYTYTCQEASISRILSILFICLGSCES